MNGNYYNQDFLIRYLLEDLTEAEAAALEDAFFADNALFEQLEIAENDLADDYARGNLTVSQREKFEAVFLNSPARRRKTAVSTLLYEAAEKMPDAAGLAETNQNVEREKFVIAARPGWRQTIESFFRAPQLIAGFAALLVLLGGAWLVWRTAQPSENLIAEQKTPALAGDHSPAAANDSPNPASSEKPAISLENSNNVIQRNGVPASTPEPKISPTPAVKVRQPPVYAVLALAAGGVREGGETKTLALSDNTTAARLRLAFDEGDFSRYNAVVRTVEGKEIWRGAAKVVKSRTGLHSATIEIPGIQLSAGDFLVTLSGAGKTGVFETIEEYYFTVKR